MLFSLIFTTKPNKRLSTTTTGGVFAWQAKGVEYRGILVKGLHALDIFNVRRLEQVREKERKLKHSTD